MSASIRPTAVAGMFYPAQAAPLLGQVRHFLEQTKPRRQTRPPKAIIVPHAGYIYSCLLYTSDAADE